jgi:hypothetical protein
MLKKATLVLFLLLPPAAWAFVKPVRVLAPELEGLACGGRVCVDDPSRRDEAEALYRDALEYVQASVGALRTAPRAVFCAAPACSEKFGFKKQNAYNVGTFAIVISHRGWRPYLVRHELIHHLQSERLGSLRNWLFKPAWFREGMAYSLSGDPRDPLAEPLQGYRSRFEAWSRQVGSAALWAEAERL